MDHYQVSGCHAYGYWILEDKQRIGEPFSDYGEAAERCELRNRLAHRHEVELLTDRKWYCKLGE